VQTVEDADVARRTRPGLMAMVEQLTDPSQSGEHEV
jgi:hypothetical protein